MYARKIPPHAILVDTCAAILGALVIFALCFI